MRLGLESFSCCPCSLPSPSPPPPPPPPPPLRPASPGAPSGVAPSGVARASIAVASTRRPPPANAATAVRDCALPCRRSYSAATSAQLAAPQCGGVGGGPAPAASPRESAAHRPQPRGAQRQALRAAPRLISLVDLHKPGRPAFGRILTGERARMDALGACHSTGAGSPRGAASAACGGFSASASQPRHHLLPYPPAAPLPGRPHHPGQPPGGRWLIFTVQVCFWGEPLGPPARRPGGGGVHFHIHGRCASGGLGVRGWGGVWGGAPRGPPARPPHARARLRAASGVCWRRRAAALKHRRRSARRKRQLKRGRGAGHEERAGRGGRQRGRAGPRGAGPARPAARRCSAAATRARTRPARGGGHANVWRPRAGARRARGSLSRGGAGAPRARARRPAPTKQWVAHKGRRRAARLGAPREHCGVGGLRAPVRLRAPCARKPGACKAVLSSDRARAPGAGPGLGLQYSVRAVRGAHGAGREGCVAVQGTGGVGCTEGGQGVGKGEGGRARPPALLSLALSGRGGSGAPPAAPPPARAAHARLGPDARRGARAGCRRARRRAGGRRHR
jgi:hypothetical protein